MPIHRSSIRRHALASTLALAAVVLAVSIAPRSAAAQCDTGCGGLGSGSFSAVPGSVVAAGTLGVLVAGGLTLSALAVDGYIAYSLPTSGHVDLGAAVYATVIWSLNLAVAVPLTFEAANIAEQQPGWLAASSIWLAVSAGSLALSIDGLAHSGTPEHRPGAHAARRALPAFALLPSSVTGVRSTAPGVTFAMRW